MMAEYLVTGGAGFIGSNIVRTLVSRGKSVRVLDDLSTGRESNLHDLRTSVDFRRGDIRDVAAVAQAVKGVRCVFHLGALPSVSRSVEEPVLSNDVNVNGTINMLVGARDGGVERFVFSSSSSVYGDTPTLPKREDMAPMPLSPYAVQKLAGESYTRIFSTLYGMKTYALRYFNVFGPYQHEKSDYAAVIPLFISAVRSGRTPVIHGDGEQTRDFTYVDDVVAANIACTTAGEGAQGQIYNVACGNRISINTLCGTIIKNMGATMIPNHLPPRQGDVRDSQADASKAKKNLNWQGDVSFEDGLKRTIAFFTRQIPE
jgi:nucleoside-diphosphate-sugar epimerase